MIRALAGLLGTRWWLLLALGIAAAGLYVDARRSRANRNAIAAWADRLCAHAGADARGRACEDAVRGLVADRADAQAETARILAAAQARQRARSETDRRAATADAAAARAAATQMETLDAKIAENDRVDGDWWAGLNRLGGLR